MKLAILRVDLRQNITLFLIIGAVMLMYFSVITYMFNPTDTSSWSDMVAMLPEGLMAGFGFDAISTNLTGFVTNFYYGFLVFVFPLIYCIVVANRLVAKMVDNGSFAYLLMSPTARKTIIFTKGLFLLGSIGALFLLLYVGGVSVCRALFGNMLNESIFLMLNINAALLTMTVGMICFFYSCYFSDAKLSLAFSSGVNIVFLLLFMLGGVSNQSEHLKGFSLFSLLNTQAILDGGGTAGVSLLLLGMIGALFALSILMFERKNLSL